jgi:hypothetical protein
MHSRASFSRGLSASSGSEEERWEGKRAESVQWSKERVEKREAPRGECEQEECGHEKARVLGDFIRDPVNMRRSCLI